MRRRHPAAARQGKEKESAARIKRFMTIMDSMTDKELDSPNPKIFQEPSRIIRLSRGSGSHPHQVLELMGARLCGRCSQLNPFEC